MIPSQIQIACQVTGKNAPLKQKLPFALTIFKNITEIFDLAGINFLPKIFVQKLRNFGVFFTEGCDNFSKFQLLIKKNVKVHSKKTRHLWSSQ